MPSKKKPAVDTKNASFAKRDDYDATLALILEKGLCPFCEKHLFEHHRKPLLFKTKHWLVTDNAWPYEGTRHHLLLVSRAHVERAEDLNSEAWTDLGRAFKRVCNLRKLAGASLLMRSGDMRLTGATVRHLHAQIIVGKKRTDESAALTAVVGFKK